MKLHSFKRPCAAAVVSLLSLGAVGVVSSAQAAIPAAEAQVLVNLYNATGGVAWTNKTNWLTAGAECTWFGITCDAGETHVVGIQLPFNKLVGGPIPALGALSQLQTLVLSSNGVTGTSAELLGLTELRTLDLRGNSFSGSMPNFGDYPHLVTVRVGPPCSAARCRIFRGCRSWRPST